jgi:DNA ligase (NAD+)
LIESHGGRNLSSVTASTDYLLAGHNMGPAKLAKAEKAGVEIISEEDFERMIADGGDISAPGAATTEKSPVQGSLF